MEPSTSNNPVLSNWWNPRVLPFMATPNHPATEIPQHLLDQFGLPALNSENIVRFCTRITTIFSALQNGTVLNEEEKQQFSVLSAGGLFIKPDDLPLMLDIAERCSLVALFSKELPFSKDSSLEQKLDAVHKHINDNRTTIIELGCETGEVTCIPEALVRSVPSLNILNVNNNQLASLGSLGDLSDLLLLNVNNNQLSTIPEALREHPKLIAGGFFDPEKILSTQRRENQALVLADAIPSKGPCPLLDVISKHERGVIFRFLSVRDLQSLFATCTKIRDEIPQHLLNRFGLPALNDDNIERFCARITTILSALQKGTILNAEEKQHVSTFSAEELFTKPSELFSILDIAEKCSFVALFSKEPPFSKDSSLEQKLDAVHKHINEDRTTINALICETGEVTCIPEELVRSVPSLNILDVDNNQVALLPDSLGDLSDLLLLCVDNNQLSTIPEALREHPKLIAGGFDPEKILSTQRRE